MQIVEFCSKYPSIFHMTNETNWASIKQHGLLSSKSYCIDILRLSDAETKQIVATHRKQSCKRIGIIFRDQKPMNEGKLMSCLKGSGLNPSQWYAVLNERVFFWTTRERLDRFVNCYAGEEVRILEVDSAKLLAEHAQNVELCHINSGATRMPNHHRSRASFQPISKFVMKHNHKPAELTVIGGVKDILNLLVTHRD